MGNTVVSSLVSGGTTLIASWGGAGDNSYIALTDAASFIPTSNIDYSNWTSASVETRTTAIILSTQDIDGLQYVGSRFYHDQLLEWPRVLRQTSFQNRLESWTLNDAEQLAMRLAVQKAVCFQVMRKLTPSGAEDHADKIASGIAAYSETAGPVSESFQYRAVSGLPPIDPRALRLLAPYLQGKRIHRA